MDFNIVHKLWLALIMLSTTVWTSPTWSQEPSASDQKKNDQAPTPASVEPRPAKWAEPLAIEGVPNLFQVNASLYRSGQPDRESFLKLKQLGIKTVINLRSFHTDRDEIGDSGLVAEHITMLAWHPEREEAVRFLQLVSDQARMPILVHCRYGSDRTGAMIALYRIAIQGWSKEEAIREMTEGGYGFNAIWFNLPSWIRGLDIEALRHEAGLEPLPTNAPSRSGQFAVIEIVDEETGRGVPLVELETIAHQRFVTDSLGRVAISDADLLDRNIFFTIRSHGYQFAKDGFGFEGKAVHLKPGSQTQLSMKRLNIAERLYRVTGSGIFIDSVVAGLANDDQPLVRGDVVGCDSIMTAAYNDKLYWFWGDTSRPHYPIGGNFHMTGATTEMSAPFAAAARERPPRFEYFTDDQGAVRSVAKMEGDGPTWLSAITVLPTTDKANQKPTLVAGFIKVRNQLEPYRWGMAVWNDATARFEEAKSFSSKPLMFCEPQTHTFLHREDGVDYVYFANPLPLTRVKANLTDFMNPDQYEGYSYLKPNLPVDQHQLNKDYAGNLICGWERNTPALTPQAEQKFIDKGWIKREDAVSGLRDIDTGKALVAHSGSVYWNKYRHRWLMIAVELGGSSSLLGEVWYAEADQPTGPWGFARKVVTHQQYSFYNPKHHPFLDSSDGSVIHFEGTYTTSFSGNPYPTPRYDYNQIMYRLDLKREDMYLPVAIYHSPDLQTPWHALARNSKEKPAFFAYDRPHPDCSGFIWDDGKFKRVENTANGAQPLFYACTAKPEGAGSEQWVPLYESESSRKHTKDYSTQKVNESARAICWVCALPSQAWAR